MNDKINLDVFNKNISMKKRKLINEPVNRDLIDKNKYANNSEYVSDAVYRRILNTISDFQWSFVPHEIIETDKFIRFIGVLIVPGYGVHTGIGSVALNKKDNTNALASAKTYAFKNACKEMGLAPNIGDENHEDELFENLNEEELEELDETDEDTLDFSEEKSKSVAETSKKKADKKSPSKTKPKKEESIDGRIEEIREAYELSEEDDFIAFLQIWNEEILELTDMEDDDWEDFFKYLESHKDEFEDF